MKRLVLIGMITAACGFAPPIATTPKSESPAAANIAHIVRQLDDEAKKARAAGGLTRNAANFADEFKDAGSPPQHQLIEKITRRADSDAFIDAYIRWQLTSFKPTLDIAKMTDREFDRLVQSLPAMLENPRADQSLLESLQGASARGTLSDAQQVAVNDKLNALATEASLTAAFNVPNAKLREWMLDQFKAQPHRALTLLLDQAESTANAGWPAEESKAAIDAALAKAARQREFTAEQRRAFVLDAEKRMVRTRMFVVSAGVSEGAIAVNYGTTGIFDYDIRRWAKAVMDEQ